MQPFLWQKQQVGIHFLPFCHLLFWEWDFFFFNSLTPNQADKSGSRSTGLCFVSTRHLRHDVCRGELVCTGLPCAKAKLSWVRRPHWAGGRQGCFMAQNSASHVLNFSHRTGPRTKSRPSVGWSWAKTCWRALPQGYVKYRLLSFMFCSVVVERENCRKGQNRTVYIFLNLLCCVSFQICCLFSKPWGLFLALLLHCSPWDAGAPQLCVRLLLWGSVCSTGPSHSSFSSRRPNIRGPKKRFLTEVLSDLSSVSLWLWSVLCCWHRDICTMQEQKSGESGVAAWLCDELLCQTGLIVICRTAVTAIEM